MATQKQHHSAKGNYAENFAVDCIEANYIVIFAENYTDEVLGKVLATEGIDVVLGKVLGVVLNKPIRQQYPGPL